MAIEWLHTAAPNDVAVTAVCDTYAGFLARAKARVKTVWGNHPATYGDYRDLLQNRQTWMPSFIMTPEHLHRDMAVAALEAGKQCTWRTVGAHDSKRDLILSAPGNSRAKWWQVGTQNRSSSLYRKPRS